MNVAGNEAMSSSLLPMLDRHERLAPQSRIIGSETVQVAKLDDIWETLDIRTHSYLKLDVQGYELHVLRGAEEHLPEISAVEAETSLQPVYGEGATHDEVSEMLRDYGFHLTAVEMGLVDRYSGRAVTLDSIWLASGVGLEEGSVCWD